MSGNPLILYTLIRSRRKTICISIVSAGEVTVKAPKNMPRQEIDSFVSKHQSWIDKHRQIVLQREKNAGAFTFADGDCVPVLGEACPIVTADTGRKGAVILDGRVLVGPEVGDREAAIIACMKRLAKEEMDRRVVHFAALMDVKYTSVKITSARTRWGSCSCRNALNFSYRLICLPPQVVNAVAVHELAHILVKNHSAAFYAQVARILPDYHERKLLLRKLGNEIPF